MSVERLGDRAICQVCVIVDNVEKYAQQYAKIFGVEVPEEYHYTAGHDETVATYYGQPTEARAKITAFSMGDIEFELLEPIGGPSVWKDFLDEHGPGVHHVAFRVKGTDHVAESFAVHGFEVSQQGLFTGLPRGMYTYLTTEDALGTTVELLESFDED
jgi:catechol 2,3-dioxygenase-like lactoylglutathione lyase family enzyme